MKNALLKDTLREVKNTLSRFLSIFAIVAIGVGFFAGIKAGGPDMKLTANQYFKDKNLMDIRLVSTMGFTHADIDAIKSVPNVNLVNPANFLDVFVEKDQSKEEIRIHTLAEPTQVNIPWLVEGRLPEHSGECVVEVAFLKDGVYKIGDKLTFLADQGESLSDTLKTEEYTIVGTVHDSRYLSYNRGNSTIGNGTIDYYIMIPQGDIIADYFSEVFITAQKSHDLFSYSQEYDKTIEKVVHSLKLTADTREEERFTEILSEAKQKLQVGIDELEEGKRKLKEEISKANTEFAKAQKEINQGYETLQREESNFNRQITAAQNKIDAGKSQYQSGLTSYESGLGEYLKGKEQLETTKAYLDANKELLPESEYEKALEEYQAGALQLERTSETLRAAKNQLESSNKTLSDSQKELNEKKSKALAEFKKAKEELSTGQKKLDEGKKKFNVEKNSAEEKLEKAQREIDNGEKKIADLKKPTWYINTRDDNPSYAEYGQNADRIDAIAKVFPVFFLLVAALVSLTTMTRMVEEQRTHIGTLKALGYSKFSIISKYFIYANLASILGSLTGLLVGFRLFPWVIFTAYGIMYDLPPVITPFHYDFALYSVLAAVLCTSLSVLAACSKELHAQPATLMRPKAPKAGKRVLLENVPFLWNRMSFTTKVTARNLFRYKKRMLMTVIGIAGCTALMLTGFGVKDSISNISEIQFGNLSNYDLLTIFDEDQEHDDIMEVLLKDKNIENFQTAYLKAIDVKGQSEKYQANIVVPQNSKVFEDFIILRTYQEKVTLHLRDDGAIITLKLSKLLDKKVGDEIVLEDSNNKMTSVKIAGIVENYIGHSIYMTPAFYSSTFKEEAPYNAIYTNMKDDADKQIDLLSEKLLAFDQVLGLSFTKDHVATFDDMITSLNFVVLVLILSASALAFVVLYNLTNINVNERLREIATIKVLGFYDKEVSAYIYRENMILTLMGTFAGFGLGALLHQFVIQTAEVNDLMFGRIISLPSYILSGLLTIAFSLFVNVVLHFRLKKVDMVESLKSVE